MLRNLDRLTARTFDLLVVGGGIYGLACAYDAALRGLAVALVERDDFGSGTSFNHLRTIHGGLRYLQTLDLRRARESVLERRTLARIAPQTVTPLPFVLPLSRSLTKGTMAMRAGFLLDRLVAFDRNRDVPASLRLPAGRVISRDEAIQRFPGLSRQGLTGAALWYDYRTAESDRLTFLFAIAAAEHGAVLANHVEATTAIVDEQPRRRVAGIRAVDCDTGRNLEIGARLTINATGAAVDHLLAPLGLTARIRLLKAMNLVTRRDAGAEALGGRARSGRTLFLVPWRGRALFGTWESAGTCAPDATPVSEAEVSLFIAELNEGFPSLDLTLGDVTLVHRGIVPAAVHRDGSVSLEGHEQLRDHAADDSAAPLEGLLSIAGTKYTTARAVAERIVNRVLEKLQVAPVECRTASTPLPGGDLGDVDLAIATARREDDRGLPADTIPHLVAAYGSRYRQVLDHATEHPEWRARLAEGSPVIGAELAWAARHEMVVTLTDAVVRRTPLGALEYPGDAAAERAAAIVGAERGWSADRMRSEICALRGFYSLTRQ